MYYEHMITCSRQSASSDGNGVVNPDDAALDIEQNECLKNILWYKKRLHLFFLTKDPKCLVHVFLMQRNLLKWVCLNMSKRKFYSEDVDGSRSGKT